MKKRKRIGRPPKPVSEVKSRIIPLRLTDADWNKLTLAAARKLMPVSDFIRKAALERSKKA